MPCAGFPFQWKTFLSLSSRVPFARHSLGLASTPVEESDHLSCLVASTPYFPAYNGHRCLIVSVCFLVFFLSVFLESSRFIVVDISPSGG